METSLLYDPNESREGLENRINDFAKVSTYERYQTIAFIQYIDEGLSRDKIVSEVGMAYIGSNKGEIIFGPYINRGPLSPLEKPADYSQRIKKIFIKNIVGFRTLKLPDILDS